MSIELGLRVRGEVDLETISSAELLDDQSEERKDADSIRITPMPRPNCRVHLREPVTMFGLFGVPLRGRRLDIYVDDAPGLVTALRERVALLGVLPPPK